MIRAILIIARRDITATVMSKGFLVWLAMPLLGLIFGLVASIASGSGEEEAAPASVAVIDAEGDFAPWLRAAASRERIRRDYAALRGRWETARGGVPYPEALRRPPALLTDSEIDALAESGALGRIEREHDLGLGEIGRALGVGREGPILTVVPPEADPDAQARRLLRPDAERFGAVLIANGDGLRILRRGDGTNIEALSVLAGHAWIRRVLAAEGLAEPIDRIRGAQPAIALETLGGAEAAEERQEDRAAALATAAAVVLFSLISLLAGVLLSNMVEEKASKVIEVLVASVPIPAIFAGKLIAMLTVSLIGVTVWGLMFGGGAALALGQLPDGLVPQPPQGWAVFIGLCLTYFVTAYLIYGAIYLGIGSLCTSIREVQTLSMPVTILQMSILVATLGAIERTGSLWGTVVSWFPLSAPYMMAARAGLGTDLAVHAAAIAWQLGFAAFVIFISARLFRYGVLRSGPPPSLKQIGRLIPVLWKKNAA